MVKKSWQDQNIKYFTYLNVLDNNERKEEHTDLFDIDSFYNDYETDDEYVIGKIKNKINNCLSLTPNEFNKKLLLNTKKSTVKFSSAAPFSLSTRTSNSPLTSINQEILLLDELNKSKFKCFFFFFG